MRTTSAQIFTKEKDDAAAAAATAVLAASASAVPSAPPLPPQSPPSPALTSSFSTPPSTPKQPPSPTLDLTPSGAAASSGAASSGAATSGAVSPLAAAEPPLDQTNLEDDPEMVTQPTQIPDPDSLPSFPLSSKLTSPHCPGCLQQCRQTSHENSGALLRSWQPTLRPFTFGRCSSCSPL